MQSVVTLLTPQGQSPDISDIPADSGAVLQRSPNKGYKEAVYKDPKGKVDSFSALCPHLGCQLQVKWLEGYFSLLSVLHRPLRRLQATNRMIPCLQGRKHKVCIDCYR